MKRIQRLRLMGTKLIEDMTEEEAKQLAMLIDTEGTIVGTKSRKSGSKPRIAVGMYSRIPVLMSELWGGTIIKRSKRRALLKGGKYMYTWNLDRRELVRSFLIKIKPYLEEKQKQAELALKMCDILDEKSQGYKQKLEELRMEISKLNHALPPDIDITKLKGIY